MHAKSDSYTSSCRSAALPYPKHGRRRMPAPMRSPCMYMYKCDFYFLGHISSCSHLCPKRRMGWAQFDRRGHVAGGLGAILAVCRAWQAFSTFLALGTLKANFRVSATSPGFGFLHPLSPCTHVRFGCKPIFFARRGYTLSLLPIFAQGTFLPPSSSPAP